MSYKSGFKIELIAVLINLTTFKLELEVIFKNFFKKIFNFFNFEDDPNIKNNPSCSDNNTLLTSFSGNKTFSCNLTGRYVGIILVN